MLKIIRKIDVLYVVTLLFLLISSNSNFLGDSNISWALLDVLMLALSIQKKQIGLKEIKFLAIFSITYLVIVVGRDVAVNELPARMQLSDVIFLFKYILLAYLYVVLIKDKLIPYLVKVIAHLAVLSLVFFLLQLIGFEDMMYNFYRSLKLPTNNVIPGYANFVIFGFTKNRHDYANSGFMWEPASYGCILSIALLLNFLNNKFRFDKNSIILLIAAVTTFSTTTYLGLFVLLFLVYSERTRKFNFWIFLIIPICILLYIKIPFLHDKINDQFDSDKYTLSHLAEVEEGDKIDHTEVGLGRFASMNYIWVRFKGELILGVTNQYEGFLSRFAHLNISNGDFDFIAKFGFAGLAYLFYCYARFCLAYLRRKVTIVFCILLLFVLAFGEPFLHLPLLLTFLFSPFFALKTVEKKKEGEMEEAKGLRRNAFIRTR